MRLLAAHAACLGTEAKCQRPALRVAEAAGMSMLPAVALQGAESELSYLQQAQRALLFCLSKKCAKINWIQKKLKDSNAPIRDAGIKSKAAAQLNQIPWMQRHATEWETA